MVKKCLIFYQIFKVCILVSNSSYIHAKIQLQHIVQNSIPSFWKIIILLFAHILYLKRTIKRVIVHHPDEITVKKKSQHRSPLMANLCFTFYHTKTKCHVFKIKCGGTVYAHSALFGTKNVPKMAVEYFGLRKDMQSLWKYCNHS